MPGWGGGGGGLLNQWEGVNRKDPTSIVQLKIEKVWIVNCEDYGIDKWFSAEDASTYSRQILNDLNCKLGC